MTLLKNSSHETVFIFSSRIHDLRSCILKPKYTKAIQQATLIAYTQKTETKFIKVILPVTRTVNLQLTEIKYIKEIQRVTQITCIQSMGTKIYQGNSTSYSDCLYTIDGGLKHSIIAVLIGPY